MAVFYDPPTPEPQPATVLLANGEEWTLGESLRSVEPGYFRFAAEDDLVNDAYILNQQVLRIGGANLAAYHAAEENFKASTNRRSKLVTGALWSALLCPIWMLFINQRWPKDEVGVEIQAIIAFLPVVFFLSLIGLLVYNFMKWRDAERAKKDQFRSAIIKTAGYLDIQIKDIGNYVLLPSS